MNKITTVAELAEMYHQDHPDCDIGEHNKNDATVRTEFSFWIDGLERDGIISIELAAGVTLTEMARGF